MERYIITKQRPSRAALSLGLLGAPTPGWLPKARTLRRRCERQLYRRLHQKIGRNA